jgi:polyferredoxin
MECIACGLCVDACDEVMEKIGLPKGLIRYDTLNHLNDPVPAKKFKAWRGRTFFYLAILITVSALMLRGLIFRSELETSFIPDRNPIFVLLSDGSIRNGYTFKIMNKTHEAKKFSLRINAPQQAILKGEEFYEVDADAINNFKIFVILPKEIIEQNQEGRGLIEFIVKDEAIGTETKASAVFVGK